MILSGTLISNLKKCGLSENEAKAYICLVIRNNSSAREIHEFTNIPRAKVYEVLDGLVAKRFAEILEGTPVHYAAIDPDELVLMLKETFETTTAEILRDFEEIEINIVDEIDETESSKLKYLRSEWTIRKKVSELLDETKKNLIIFSQSPAVLKRIESELVSIKKRLNVIVLVSSVEGYEDISLPFTIFPENIKPLLQELENSHYPIQKCFIITDVKKAIAIGEYNSKLEAHYISQPVIDYLYKTIYYFVSNADTIILPPEFFESEKKNESKKAPATATKKNAESKK